MRVISGTAPAGRIVLLLGSLALVSAPSLLAQEEEWSARDVWQRPATVMDALGIGRGSVVADVGCGDGYFAFRLADRVGPVGRVYAVDVDAQARDTLRNKAEAQSLGQLETILGSSDDPRLPEASLDAVLVVNAYHEMTAYDAMLEALRHALKPGGRLAIIDKTAEPGESRSAYQERHSLPKQFAVGDAARHGLVLVREEPGFVRPRRGGEPWYFLVFAKPMLDAVQRGEGAARKRTELRLC
jgi:predicted methyltransferase